MAGTTDWFVPFFSNEGYLAFHHAFVSRGQTSEQADFIEKAMSLAAPNELLDVPCGEGRMAIELARRGHHLTGVDLSEPLISEAQEISASEDLELRWEHGDMRELLWREEFDGAVCWWGSWGYFDDEGNRRFARAVAAALRPGRRFLIETHCAETLLPRFNRRGWSELDDTLVLESREWDHRTGRIETDWTFIRDGERREQHSSIRLYAYNELEALLRDAGFVTFEAFDSTSGEPFELGAARLAIVASKG